MLSFGVAKISLGCLLLCPPHVEYRERIALFVGLVAAERAESHVPVEAFGLSVLFVDVHVFRPVAVDGQVYHFPSQAFPYGGGGEEQHLYLVLLYAHEADRLRSLPSDDEVPDALQGGFHLRYEGADVLLGQEVVGGPYGTVPYGGQVIYEFCISLSAELFCLSLDHAFSVFPFACSRLVSCRCLREGGSIPGP